jgi:hypothetical protein
MIRKLFSRWLLLPAMALATLATLSYGQGSLGISICKDQPIPAGYVKIGETFKPGCPNPGNDLNNAYLIAKIN